MTATVILFDRTARRIQPPMQQRDSQMTTLAQAIRHAMAADDAFDVALVAAGYKSRWDWIKAKDSRPMAAYDAKVSADLFVHTLFERSRRLRYQVESESMEGQMTILPVDSLAEAKKRAATLSKENITAYAVVLDGTESIGHIAYGEGRVTETLGDCTE